MTAASPMQLLRPVHAARVWWPHRDLRTRSLAVPGPRLRQSAAPLITAQPHDSQLRCEQAFCEMPTVGAGRSVPQTELGARPRSICHGLVTENSPVPATSLPPGSKHQPTNTPPTGAPNSPKSRKNGGPTLTPRLRSSGRRARGSPRRSVALFPGPQAHFGTTQTLQRLLRTAFVLFRWGRGRRASARASNTYNHRHRGTTGPAAGLS